jgi:hypothetical protein
MEDIEWLEFAIAEIISNEVYLRDVPYSLEDGAQEKDPDSVMDAAREIVKYLMVRELLNG